MTSNFLREMPPPTRCRVALSQASATIARALTWKEMTMRRQRPIWPGEADIGRRAEQRYRDRAQLVVGQAGNLRDNDVRMILLDFGVQNTGAARERRDLGRRVRRGEMPCD